MKVNGNSIRLGQEKTLEEFLLSQNYDLGKIAVERNREIVSKSTYGQVLLTEADILEVVSFVGGG